MSIYIKGGDNMSEREKQFVELLAKMPEAAQDSFLAQAQGAVIMLDALRKDKKEGSNNAEGEVHNGE